MAASLWGRREFIRSGAQTLSLLSLTGTLDPSVARAGQDHERGMPPNGKHPARDPMLPWYRRALRWGQTNITERDPPHYDVAWWQEYWHRTAIQGVIINAGGIVAYYPSRFPLHRQAEFLNGRDLYGELSKAAHAAGLVVLARIDSNRASEEFFHAHPDWFARKQSGEPYKAGERYVACINGSYIEEYIPGILREIIERTHPEGFGDNNWSGLSRDEICYCENCARKFREQVGLALPDGKNWNDVAYRRWVQWSYARRLQLWDFNNKIVQSSGGPHCLWLGMNTGSVSAQSALLRDFREIAKRSEFMLLDEQFRSDATGFQRNADTGKLVHGLIGWEKTIIESTALYDVSAPLPGDLDNTAPAFSTFRMAAKPEPEVRMWMIEGIAGGISPWWHIVGAYHDDRRMYPTPERVFQWHMRQQKYLTDYCPLAAVGLLWSQRNTDYYGRDNCLERVEEPYWGFARALIRARIPYVPINANDIEEQATELAALVLPNVGALSKAECAAIRKFAHRGGSVVATGAASLYDEWGDARPDLALSDLFGVHDPSPDFGHRQPQQVQSYLRLMPELRGRTWGPRLPDDPVSGDRHPVLRGFDATDIIPFGGELENLRTDADTTVPLTFVPAFPTHPPETAWMREPHTQIPGLVLKSVGGARVAYLQADLDRRYARGNLPDHANLLANIVKWAAGDRLGFELRGPGLIDCHPYRQPGRLIVHLVNLTNEATWRAPIDEIIPVGPLTLKVALPQDIRGESARSLVSASKLTMQGHNNWVTVKITSISDHEVLVIS